MTIVWPGSPGDTYTNTTGHILYQLHCAWHNTCGACAQYDLAIAEYWGKFHRGCACVSTPIYPGSAGVPYIDWQETIGELPKDQQKRLVGVGNWNLIESGDVKWTDVVTQTRVRTLQEVVSRENLTVDQMIKAGVQPDVAEKAWATVNTPEHILAQMQRSDLVQQILNSGITPKTLTEMFGEKMAERIILAEGPSGMQTLPGFKDNAAWTKLIMESFNVGTAIAAMSVATSPTKQSQQFTPSQATIDVPPDEMSDVQSSIQSIFGRDVSLQDLATLIGASDNTTVTISAYKNSITVYVKGPGIDMVREIKKTSQGAKIENVSFFLSEDLQGQGIGAQAFGREIQQAQELGVNKITTFASKAEDAVGYAVWPKFGYNGPLPEAIIAKLPPEFAGATQISDLYATPEGQAWWAANGSSINLTFDTTPGSYSMDVWNAYLASKGK